MAPSVKPTSWVQKTPGVCGGDACIRELRVPVWALVEWRKLGLTDARILEHYPQLTQRDLNAASDYYERHREEIDHAILENDAAMTEASEG